MGSVITTSVRVPEPCPCCPAPGTRVPGLIYTCVCVCVCAQGVSSAGAGAFRGQKFWTQRTWQHSAAGLLRSTALPVSCLSRVINFSNSLNQSFLHALPCPALLQRSGYGSGISVLGQSRLLGGKRRGQGKPSLFSAVWSQVCRKRCKATKALILISEMQQRQRDARRPYAFP